MPEYRPIPAAEGCTEWPEWYRVGDDSTAWTRRKRGRFGGIGPWRQLKPVVVVEDRGGTLKVQLMLDGTKRKGRMVAVDVCVCRAFHGPRPLGHAPFHWPDPDPANCRADNLRWAPRGTRQLGIDPRKGDPRLELKTARGHRPSLTDDQVIMARKACADGQTAGDVAKELGVPRYIVDLAVRGKTYADLPGAIPHRPLRARGTDVSLSKINELIVLEIREAAARGETRKQIAARIGQSYQLVRDVLRGHTWKHVQSEEENP